VAAVLERNFGERGCSDGSRNDSNSLDYDLDGTAFHDREDLGTSCVGGDGDGVAEIAAAAADFLDNETRTDDYSVHHHIVVVHCDGVDVPWEEELTLVLVVHERNWTAPSFVLVVHVHEPS
jgi:hypothetical protein